MAWMDKVINRVGTSHCHLKSRKGQTVVEYAVVLAFISVLCVTYLSALGEQIRGLFLSIINALAAAGHGF
jgi:Flp pilus assembly pilin Flp